MRPPRERHDLRLVSGHACEVIPSVHAPRELPCVVESVLHATQTRLGIEGHLFCHVNQAAWCESARTVVLDRAGMTEGRVTDKRGGRAHNDISLTAREGVLPLDSNTFF